MIVAAARIPVSVTIAMLLKYFKPFLFDLLSNTFWLSEGPVVEVNSTKRHRHCLDSTLNLNLLVSFISKTGKSSFSTLLGLTRPSFC